MAAAQLLHRAGGQVKVPTFLVPATQKVRAAPFHAHQPRHHTEECTRKKAE